MNKKILTDEEMDELKSLISQKSKITIYVAILTAITALVSALGTAAAGIIVAIKTK